MHAIRLHAFGPAEHLTYEKTEDPEPGPGQVRIAVEAAGVHLLDTALRQGVRGPAPELPALPTVPGREVAGTVGALGADTDPAWLGKRVVAHLGMVPGGYAELAVTDAARLHEIPAGLDAARAVALIGTGRTALGILGFTTVTPDTVALVPAAAGGVGTLLVQYVKHAGGTVVGLAGGPAKTGLVAANGADLAVDYTDPGWPARVREFLGERRVTVLFDGVGGATTAAALDLLGPGAQHLIFGWSAQGLDDTAVPVLLDEADRNRRGITQVRTVGPEMMRRAGGANPMRTLELAALDLGARSVLAPAVSRFPLSEAAAAHRALESRGTTGKVVLEP
ncbi:MULTISPECIES: zinc-binding dehydrogenase [unclassified Streptomyces]|uniref:zinc-binding dehydrogenase n=1 Tax=unclassified Streptomyces TaxID=2593676 RepID=UPI000DB997FF|nr:MULTISPECIES: zinc-binding dehydrogenase [unclassified Streptomyces]MYT72239.1 zinc-binding dehydrogenase [Streptomyces sp. SID8367]RAJ81652.1 NADPH:quinone reductase-like Zn-dependent oxidoreductase [Streptomyces sp. PsTaAH-137]